MNVTQSAGAAVGDASGEPSGIGFGHCGSASNRATTSLKVSMTCCTDGATLAVPRHDEKNRPLATV